NGSKKPAASPASSQPGPQGRAAPTASGPPPRTGLTRRAGAIVSRSVGKARRAASKRSAALRRGAPGPGNFTTTPTLTTPPADAHTTHLAVLADKVHHAGMLM